MSERSLAGPRRVVVWGAATLAALLTIAVALLFVTRAKRRSQTPTVASAIAHPADGRLPILAEVPPFAFTNIDGRLIDRSALLGHVWIADLIFTNCTTLCPMITAKMNVLRRSIPSAEIRFVSFSIDPEHDTPAVLRAYASRWKADPRWLLLSPPPGQEIEFAKAMNAPFKRTAMPLEPIMHSTSFFLIDQLGRVRGLYGGLDDAAVRRLASDVALLDTSAVRRDGESQLSGETSASRGAARGQVLFQDLGCAACHAEPKTGPPLAGLAGRTVRLEGGATVVADASYLRASILAPMQKVVAGYNPLMPAYGDFLAPADVDDLVAYLQSIPPGQR